MKTKFHDPLEFEVLASGLGFTEGPVVTPDGTVYAVDIDGGRVLRIRDKVVDVVASPGGGPNGLALETSSTGIVANNGGFLWSEVEGGVRIPIDRATHTNEPPGFTGGWLERVDLQLGRGHRAAPRVRQPPPARSERPRVRRGRRPVVHRPRQGAARQRRPGWALLRAARWDRPSARSRFPSSDRTAWGCRPTAAGCTSRRPTPAGCGPGISAGPGEVRAAAGSLAVRHGGTCLAATPFSFDSLAIEADGRIVIGAIADGIVVITPDGEEVDVYPVPGDVTTNVAFGGPDGRRAVITLSRTGSVVEASWPRPGLVVGPPGS